MRTRLCPPARADAAAAMGMIVGSALQTLHRVSCRAREQNLFLSGASHDWVGYYEERIQSERSYLNEWHAMDCIESRRPPSPDSVRTKPREREETERVIRTTLKEIMMSVDLDEVTSKVIRGRLEEELDMDLVEFKSFIDEEMLTILGQMDKPTEIFDHVYLGSEWNASNLEELQKNGVRHILNVTREIDNFFPGRFDYLNIRVYDDEKTDLLKHWDNTFKYISRARKEGSKVLVHCKMGVSRSASVVIAYAMKAFDWNFDKAMKHVKEKRTCIKPNTSFLSQLETYEGILDAMKNKEKLQRSKSETNLKSPGLVSKTDSRIMEPTPLIQAMSGRCRGRPRSWSPDTRLASHLLPPTSVSLENLAPEARNVLMPYANGSYSVSQNQIMRIREDGIPSVKHIVNELESHAAAVDRKAHRERRNLKLNLANHIDTLKYSPVDGDIDSGNRTDEKTSEMTESKFHFDTWNGNQIITNPTKTKEMMDKTETWDPGESSVEDKKYLYDSDMNSDSKTLNEIVKCDSGVADLRFKPRLSGDSFSKEVDRVFDKEERKQESEVSDRQDGHGPPPSRQGSWSSCDSAVVSEKPSRHSSWGSYDTKPSRNSSWGSYDEPWNMGTVKRTKQKLEEGSSKRICSDAEHSCNGVNEAINTVLTHKTSAPICDLDIINENHEHNCINTSKNLINANGISVKVENSMKKNEDTCAILKELDFNNSEDFCSLRKQRGGGACCSQLSASAPTASSIIFLDRFPLSPSSNSVGNLYCSKHLDLPNSSSASTLGSAKHKKSEKPITINRSMSGKVQNLKMEFEAKSITKNDSKNASNCEATQQTVSTGGSNNNGKGRSLPSSPVSIHVDKQKHPEHTTVSGNTGQTASMEDLSVKVLVGKYDRPKSQQFPSKTNISEPPVPLRKSSLNRDIDNNAQKKQFLPSSRNSICGIPKVPVSLRPPVNPTVLAMAPLTFPAKVVVASVVAQANKKQLQHGKTHPLARLKNHTTNRCSNTVYNTM